MEREEFIEFNTIREAAYDGLRQREFIDHRSSLTVCQLLFLPSFDNAVSWDVVYADARRGSEQAWLYRTCWRKDIDCVAMSSPVERLKHPRPYPPTIEVDRVKIERRSVETLLTRFRADPIPLSVECAPFGCDGSTIELSLGHSFCSARISWWCELPKEWEKLRSIVDELKQLFEQAWNGRGEESTE